jgi:hypothetical protein
VADAVIKAIMRIPSHTLPRRAAYFSEGTTLG